MNKRIMAAAFSAAALGASAGDFSGIGALTQEEFRGLSRDLGAAFSYKGITPATPLGALGVDVGVEVTDTRLEHESLFSRAGAGSPSHLVVPKVHIHKGLPGGFDVGAFVGGTSQVSAALFGADVRYAVLDDGLATPAVGVRLSGTRATGLGELKVSTGALDVTVSKRFVALTPYAGGGVVRTWSSASGFGLQEERQNRGRFFGGVNLNLLAVNLAFEAEKSGDNTSLSAKLGLRF
ncbi:MAG TPA: hypothetical protein VFP36_15100 [Usitatibacter sp.]|nr:hypothetical protein [Usitatibacter sp.]